MIDKTNANELLPLYVVILNWNLPRDTIACVNSLRQGLPAETTIVVVDNGSTDGSPAILHATFGDDVLLLKNATNLGFAGGVNVGIDEALRRGARGILLLNNDTLVDPAMIRELLGAARALPRAGLIGPIIYYHDAPARVWRFGDREHRWLPIPLRIGNRALAKAGDRPLPADYVTACGVLIRREVFEKIGRFDPRYFMYFEDADFCRRARAAGFEIWCVPTAKMWHKVSLSAKKDKPANRYALAWGRARFYHTHRRGVTALLICLYLLTKVTRITLLDLLKRDGDLIRPLWLGTLDGRRAKAQRWSKLVK